MTNRELLKKIRELKPKALYVIAKTKSRTVALDEDDSNYTIDVISVKANQADIKRILRKHSEEPAFWSFDYDTLVESMFLTRYENEKSKYSIVG